MGVCRHIAQLLFVVTVLVAAGFVSSAAQAHPGHAHAAPRAVAVSPSDTVGGANVEIAQSNAEVRAQYAIASRGIPFAARECNGACCGTGLVCCAPALALDNICLRRPTSRSSLVVWPDTPTHSGVFLEALPKPPRPFA